MSHTINCLETACTAQLNASRLMACLPCQQLPADSENTVKTAPCLQDSMVASTTSTSQMYTLSINRLAPQQHAQLAQLNASVNGTAYTLCSSSSQPALLPAYDSIAGAAHVSVSVRIDPAHSEQIHLLAAQCEHAMATCT